MILSPVYRCPAILWICSISISIPPAGTILNPFSICFVLHPFSICIYIVFSIIYPFTDSFFSIRLHIIDIINPSVHSHASICAYIICITYPLVCSHSSTAFKIIPLSIVLYPSGLHITACIKMILSPVYRCPAILRVCSISISIPPAGTILNPFPIIII